MVKLSVLWCLSYLGLHFYHENGECHKFLLFSFIICNPKYVYPEFVNLLLDQHKYEFSVGPVWGSEIDIRYILFPKNKQEKKILVK